MSPHESVTGIVGIEATRRALRDLSSEIPEAEEVSYHRVEAGEASGVPHLSISPPRSQDQAIWYVHGGAFCLLTVEHYRKTLGHLAVHTRSQIVAPDYRIAPEHPYPVPLLDVLASYVWVTSRYQANTLTVCADSAGANLALGALSLAQDLGLTMASRLVMFSPWLDLTLRGRSVSTNAEHDTQLNRRDLQRYAAAYAGQTDPNSPFLSPIVPIVPLEIETYIQVGSAELLLDDSLNFAANARSFGMTVDVDVFDGMQHNFQFWASLLPEAVEAMRRVQARI